MSFISKLGQCLGGVRTIDALKTRCEVQEITECWIWQGAVHKGTGMVWLPELNTTRGVAFAAMYLVGRRPNKGRVAFAKCMTKLCCNPDHCVGYTRKQITDTLVAAGKFKADPKRVLALAKHSKARRRLTEEQAEEVRRSNETGEELAKRLNVHRGVISRVRRGETYRRQEIPGASVFSFAHKEAA